MAILLNCCCCIGLQRGTLILGILGIIGSVLILISSVISLINLNRLQYNIDFENPSQGEKDAVKLYRGFNIGAIVGSIISAVISSLMIFGTMKGSRMFLLPWLIWSVIGMAIAVISTILLATSGVLSPIIAIATGIQLFIGIYYWLVVFSFFQELRDREVVFSSVPTTGPYDSQQSHDPKMDVP